MAKEQLRKRVSLNPDDAPDGGGKFMGGVTTIHTHRFRLGYLKKDGTVSEPDLPVLTITHTPKASGEKRMEYLSCGNKARGAFKVEDKGNALRPIADLDSPFKSCSAMQYMDSLAKAGVPKNVLGKGSLDVLDNIVVHLAQKPMEAWSGLDGIDGAPAETRTSLVVKKILKSKWDAQDADAEEETEEADDDEKDEDTEEETEEADEETSEDADDDEASDDAEADEDEDEEDEDEESDVDDKLVGKALVDLLKAEGGSIKRTKLTGIALGKFRKDPNRNAICTRMVEEDFLAKGKGWVYDKKAGVIKSAKK